MGILLDRGIVFGWLDFVEVGGCACLTTSSSERPHWEVHSARRQTCGSIWLSDYSVSMSLTKSLYPGSPCTQKLKFFLSASSLVYHLSQITVLHPHHTFSSLFPPVTYPLTQGFLVEGGQTVKDHHPSLRITGLVQPPYFIYPELETHRHLGLSTGSQSLIEEQKPNLLFWTGLSVADLPEPLFMPR